MISFHPKLIGTRPFDEVSKEFFETARFDSVQMEITRLELFDFFGDLNSAQIQPHLKTYWPFYVYSIWINPLTIAPEIMADNISKQLPDATRLGFNVFKKIIEYAHFKLTLEPEIKSFFSKVNEALSHSDWPIGKLPDQTVYTVADCIKELVLLESMRDNTMDYANFYEKLSRMIFPQGLNEEIYKKEYISISIHDALEEFVNTLLILTQQTPDDLYAMVDEYTHPEIYDPDYYSTAPAEEPQVSAEPEKLEVLANEPPAVLPVAPVLPKSEPVKAVSETPVPVAPVKPSYAEIRKKIEGVFKKNAQGEYDNLDGVMAALQSASEKYKDPKIAELMYFDESDNKFKWSV